MRLCFICQASIEAGFGHLARTMTFVNAIANDTRVTSIDLYLVADILPFDVEKRYGRAPIIISSEKDIPERAFDIIFLDCLEIDHKKLERLKSQARLTVSLSPVFNNFNMVDILFTRSTFQDTTHQDKTPLKIYSGPDFSLIGNKLNKISAGLYESNLENGRFSLGICMGATDPLNKTQELLEALASWEHPCLIWVAIGDGYKHNIKVLQDIAKNNSLHELVIASTNDSFWAVLQNCSILLLQGGITTYEAAYCGIPSINFPRSHDHFHLCSDLVSRKLSWIFDVNYNSHELIKLLEDLSLNKTLLLEMHIKLKSLIDDNGPKRIFDTVVRQANF